MARMMKMVAREKIGTKRQRAAAAAWLREIRRYLRPTGARAVKAPGTLFWVMYQGGYGRQWVRFTADGVMEYQEIESVATRKAA